MQVPKSSRNSIRRWETVTLNSKETSLFSNLLNTSMIRCSSMGWHWYSRSTSCRNTFSLDCRNTTITCQMNWNHFWHAYVMHWVISPTSVQWLYSSGHASICGYDRVNWLASRGSMDKVKYEDLFSHPQTYLIHGVHHNCFRSVDLPSCQHGLRHMVKYEDLFSHPQTYLIYGVHHNCFRSVSTWWVMLSISCPLTSHEIFWCPFQPGSTWESRSLKKNSRLEENSSTYHWADRYLC